MPGDHRRALANVQLTPFWLDTPRRPAPHDSLVARVSCDLAVVGGGFTGLWTALQAKERNPDTDVVLLEANRIGWAATGRNGGFCLASLTHGLENGMARFADEMPRLEQLARDNFGDLRATASRPHGDLIGVAAGRGRGR